MHDDKRQLRKLKRQIKKAGNRKRRRYFKDVAAPADDFQFGRDRTDVMNEPPRQPRGEQAQNRPSEQRSDNRCSLARRNR